jgi:hypothetical protein
VRFNEFCPGFDADGLHLALVFNSDSDDMLPINSTLMSDIWQRLNRFPRDACFNTSRKSTPVCPASIPDLAISSRTSSEGLIMEAAFWRLRVSGGDSESV